MFIPRTSRLAGALAACCGLLLLAACEDPSGAGLSVIDFGDSDPLSRVVPAEAKLDSLSDFTGLTRTPGDEFQHRTLAGRAEDPLFGDIRATGHIDFVLPGAIPEGFFFSPIEHGFLDLVIDYVYGDTTTVTTIDVFEISEAWNPAEFTPDASVVVDSKRLLATFSVAASDTLVRVPLSDDWIEERDSLFRAVGFELNFHGLQFRSRDDDRLIVGLKGTSSFALMYRPEGPETDPDTLRLQPSAVGTSVTRENEKTISRDDELLLMQDNTNTGLSMTFRLDTLDTRAISAGFVRLHVDTLLARPPNFVRPITRTLLLYGIREGGVPEFLASGTLNDEKGEFLFSSINLSLTLQNMALNRSRYDNLMVGFPIVPVSVNVAPVVNTPDRSPRVVVLVVPQDA